jgi:hypothetical protein
MDGLLASEAVLSAHHLGKPKKKNVNPAHISNRTAFHPAGQLENVFLRMGDVDERERHIQQYFTAVNAEIASLSNCNVKIKLKTWHCDQHHRFDARPPASPFIPR